MHKSHFWDPQTHFCVCNDVCNYLCVCNDVCDVCVLHNDKKNKKNKKAKSFLTNFRILLILNNHVNSKI